LQQSGEILQAACDLITATLDTGILAEAISQKLLNQFIEASMRRREAECQEAVARVFGRLSVLRACEKEVMK
jgi:hypothetical protein